jgi:outer membrane protein insertion porin family
MGQNNYIKKNMLIFKYIILIKALLFLTLVPLKSEVIDQLIISGNKRVSEETIKIYGNVQLKKNIDEITLDKILKNLYSTNFFEDVKLKVSNNILTITVKEYPVINQLLLVGEKSTKIKDQIKKLISSKQKNSFIKSNISKDIEIIKKLYASIGYNFSKIDAKIKSVNDNNLDLIIEIKRGEQTKISSISFLGDKKIRGNRLRDIIASEEDKFWKILSKNTKFSENLINLDLRLLNNYYKSLGYYDVKINSNTAEINKIGNIDLIYSIEAGNRYRINKILTNVDPTFDKNLFIPLNKSYKKFIGDFYSPFKIKKLLDEVDILISRNDLQFVEHNVEEIIEGTSITIKFNIFEGEKVLVERINIRGNSITDEAVIRGELLLDEGDPFTKISLDKSTSNIKSKRIFSDVISKVTDGSDKNLKIIDIEVEEMPTGEISAGAGFGTNGGTFAINVVENNWLGQGKIVNFEIELDATSIAGGIDYLDPNYNFLGNQIAYSFGTTTNDKPDQGYKNTLIEGSVNTKFEQYKNLYTSLGVATSYDDLRVLSTASDSLKKQSGSFKEIAGVYGFTYDTRDRSFMPTSGGVHSFKQTLPVISDKKYVSNSLTSSRYKSFSEDLLGAGKFYFNSVTGLGGDDARISKRTNLSTSRLRGFESGKVGPVDSGDHVGGNYAASLNIETSLPNLLPESTNTDIGFFLDFGNVWGVDYDASIDASNKIRASTGVAASWKSPLGPMTFILSTNLAKADTDKTETFNFNLGTTF